MFGLMSNSKTDTLLPVKEHAKRTKKLGTTTLSICYLPSSQNCLGLLVCGQRLEEAIFSKSVIIFFFL